MRSYFIVAVSLWALSACSELTQSTTTQVPQTPEDSAALSVERVFASPSLVGAAPRGLQFSPDGSRITFLKSKEDDRTVLDLWAMDVADGRTYTLVDARTIAPQERELSEAEIQYRERARIFNSGIISYKWDESGRAVLVPIDGDAFYIDVASGEAQRLMETDEFETDFKVSPDGRHVSFIRDQNLWVHNLETGEARAITTQGAGPISWGVAEFVAQEEMNRYTGYWWSPTGDQIAVARVDETPVQIVPRFGINAEGVTVTNQRYPRSGTPNALIELWVIDVENGDRQQVNLGDNIDIYLARVDWNKDGSQLYAQRQNREQTVLDLLAVDPQTGDSDIVLSEEAESWINLTYDFTPLKNGGFLWTSERDGYRHIYRYTAERSFNQITSGDWVVDTLSGVSEDEQTVYFEGWVNSPLERHLYSVNIAGGDPVQITKGEGRWSATLGKGGSSYVGAFQNPETPPQTGLYAIDGSLTSWIEENALDESHPYAPYLGSHIAPEFGTLTANDGQTELYWSMLKPDHCSAQTPCPAIVQVYGGPHVQTVTKGWVGARDQLFADKGYILFKLDNRGSWNRGHAFEAHIHDVMGTIEVEDQLTGLEFLKTQAFVDTDRIGLWGWSYGGYMTLMTTLQAPNAFDAAVSGAPVTHWSLYDTHYTERYMNTPQNNSDGYEIGSVFAHVDNYKTPTLLIHGMADDNVTFDHSTKLYALLQEQNADFEMMTYPGQRHGVRPPPLQTHLWTSIFAYFDRRLALEES